VLGIERKYWDEGLVRVAGVDEAGRGPLAGPVVASAVVLSVEFAQLEEHGLLEGLTDSKKLSESRREGFAEILRSSACVEIGIGISGTAEIDRLNILNATHLAMARAVRDLPSLPELILVDGLAVKGLPRPSVPIVRGDSKSLSIAAASIIAKTTRDARMRELDTVYPQYGFAAHKGYGTRAHIQALYEHGPSPEHRRSFSPVREAEENLSGGESQQTLFD
jgi:ribonuclease HII